MERKIKRGDIYYANLNPVIGSEQGGTRPVLIISNDVGNKYSPTVIVAPITSRIHTKAKLPTHTLINSDNCENGFYYTSIEEMKDTIAFWKREYQSRYYVRWAIIDKNANCAIGTIELFNRKANDYFNDCGLLRLDLRSDYEKQDTEYSGSF